MKTEEKPSEYVLRALDEGKTPEEISKDLLRKYGNQPEKSSEKRR